MWRSIRATPGITRVATEDLGKSVEGEGAMSGSTTNEVQGAARRRVLRAVSSSPARRLQLLLLADRQSSRCRGSNRADLPAGLSPFRARPARVSREAAAPMADPYSPQSCRQSLSRSLAPPVVLDRRGIRAGEPAH